jgi:hypothetical protein
MLSRNLDALLDAGYRALFASLLPYLKRGGGGTFSICGSGIDAEGGVAIYK